MHRKCILLIENEPEDDRFIMSYIVSDDTGLPC